MGIDFNITIVGLGLIGGSYAKALRKKSPKKLWAVDIDSNAIKEAEKEGVIDKGYLNAKIPLNQSDIVIMCLYPEMLLEFVKTNKENFKKGAIITDVLGIKGELIEKVNTVLGEEVDFIGGHPMAGKEVSGFNAATSELFKGANYIITPVDKNKEENIKIVEDLVKKIGCKTITKVTPEKHDEMIAYTSQLAHVIASAMVQNPLLDDGAYLFCGGSFSDITRVAMINAELWSQLLIENSSNIVKQIEVFEKNVEVIKRAIMKKDKIYLKNILSEVRSKKEELL